MSSINTNGMTFSCQLDPGHPGTCMWNNGSDAVTFTTIFWQPQNPHTKDSGSNVNPTQGAQRVQALENLWSAIKDEENWKLGYNPAMHEAIKALKELEQRDKYSEET